tara:strand:+ start:497 stop:820 length:324 start_codon:yes stop_codon:yes gene_type:complete
MKNIIKYIIKFSFLSFILVINYFNTNTIPLTISLVVLYLFYLNSKIRNLVNETQINVNLIEKQDASIKELNNNQKILIKTVKDFRNKVNITLGKNKQNKSIDNKEEI